ncbi:hypothetical protein THAOC_24076, partial [Thalassiosira oceanica]
RRDGRAGAADVPSASRSPSRSARSRSARVEPGPVDAGPEGVGPRHDGEGVVVLVLEGGEGLPASRPVGLDCISEGVRAVREACHEDA